MKEENTKREEEMQNDPIPELQPDPPRAFRVNMHLIIVAIIVIVAGTAIFRLMRWNQGTVSDYDPDFISTDFDVEELDMIIPMDQARLAGREDDGELHILCLGNNPFSDETGKNGLAAMIAEKTDATVYNAAFPDSSVACKYAVYNPEYRDDLFNLYYVSQSFITGDFLNAIESVAVEKEADAYKEAIQVLKGLDMDKIDVIVIMYDSTDYNMLTPSDNPANPYDVTSYTGGLRLALKNIQEAYPYIRIFLMSHSYAEYLDEDGDVKSGTTTDLGHGDLPHYLQMQVEVAMDQGVSFVDNYFGTINEDNYKEYLSDHMHYNKKGREKLAERIADIIIHKSGTVSSETGQ